jgi:multiple sugar transport system substrate-binding protein
MRKTIMKNGLAAIALAMLVLACQGAPEGKGSSATAGPKKIVVWTFTKELKELVQLYEKSPRYDAAKASFEVISIPASEFQGKLDIALRAKDGAPDVVTLESAFLGKYVESGRFADLSSLAPAYAKSFKYAVDAATDRTGKVRALTWQVAPGCYYYRRSLAKKYLGNDDPAFVQGKMLNIDVFKVTARQLKLASAGSARIVCSSSDLFQVFKGARRKGWVSDGRLVIDPAMMDFLKVSRLFREEGLEARIEMWTEDWFEAMRSRVKTGSGDVEVLGYFLPTWGLQYVLKPNAKDSLGLSGTSGDWAMVPGPSPYFWGGTWVAARADGRNAEEAVKLIEFIGTDAGMQRAWADTTGDIVSSRDAAESVEGGYAESFLGGQNYYSAFVDIAASVNGKTLSANDGVLDDLWQKQQKAFAAGKMSEAAALTEFRAVAKKALPTLDVR